MAGSISITSPLNNATVTTSFPVMGTVVPGGEGDGLVVECVINYPEQSMIPDYTTTVNVPPNQYTCPISNATPTPSGTTAELTARLGTMSGGQFTDIPPPDGPIVAGPITITITPPM
jgi:hypothetical protein